MRCRLTTSNGAQRNSIFRLRKYPSRSVADALRTLAFRVGLILSRPLKIFFCNGNDFEVTGVRKAGGIKCRIFRQFWNRNGRQFAPDDFALEWIVVCKYQRINSDIQSFGNATEVGGLVRPVRDETCDIRPLEYHLGMPVKRLPGVCLIVFRAHGQNHTAPGKVTDIFLESNKSFPACTTLPQYNATQPVVTDNTPHSVLSRSSTRHFDDRPCPAAKSLPTRSP